MALIVGGLALACLAAAGAALGLALQERRRRLGRRGHAPAFQGVAQAELDAAALVSEARADALATRVAAQAELSRRAAALDAIEPVLEDRERALRERRQQFDERRHAVRERREAMEEELGGVEALGSRRWEILVAASGIERDEAAAEVLDQVEAELRGEHEERVERAVAARVGDPEAAARLLLVQAMERQDGPHTDDAPRLAPLTLEGFDDDARQRLLETLGAIAEQTGTELAVDPERSVATLRGIDPLGREVARRTSLEALDRRLQVAEVGPLLMRTRSELADRVADIGERALWEMQMAGRPELAELMGILHYRFSYGQNALLHCKETGYLCAVLAAELGLPPAPAREAGTLHDIGKAVDHSVEGSHAIIGGELLRLFGVDPGIVHAVKAHHFDEEPSTDLAMLTICADAVSASRPGARRDTLAAYLARLEQLQEIATRHAGVERAFPLQAGRELRVVVRGRDVPDDAVPALSGEIAREIEAEMQYPGVIKVVVIRETAATATAPAQVPVITAAPPEEGAAAAGEADAEAAAEEEAASA